MAAPVQCVILIGGLGTRLGDLTVDVPKPLLSVGSRPFLEYLLIEAARFGFKKILLLAGHRSERVGAYLAESAIAQKLSLQIDLMIEDKPAGTGGALWLARERIDSSFYLLNGDSWFDFNWLSLVTVEGSGQAVATMALRQIDEVSRYGAVETNDTLISRFLERPDRSGPAKMNSGVYFLSREVISYLSPNCSLEADIFPRLAEARLLRAQTFSGNFIDIGIPKDFAAAQTLIPHWQQRPAVFFDRDGTLNDDTNYVHKVPDFHWLPGAIESIRRLNDAGFYVFVVTNQAGIAHGMYGEHDVRALHAWMQEQLREQGAHVDDFRFCPYHPDATIEAYRQAHAWRKPSPGMVLDLIDRWPIERARSVMIGDKDLDVAAGHAAGIAAFKVGTKGLLPQISTLISQYRSSA